MTYVERWGSCRQAAIRLIMERLEEGDRKDSANYLYCLSTVCPLRVPGSFCKLALTQRNGDRLEGKAERVGRKEIRKHVGLNFSPPYF